MALLDASRREALGLPPKEASPAVPAALLLLLELEPHLILTFLAIFLVLNVFANHLRIKPYRINAVTRGPEMIAPIRTLPKVRKLLEHPDRRPPLDDPHVVRIDTLGGIITIR